MIAEPALRVLHAVCSDAFAGVERHVARLAGAQAAAGHRVIVIGGDPTAMRSAVGSWSVPTLPGLGVLEVARHIRRLARGADIVHVHMTATEIAASIALALPRPRAAVVATRHFARPRGSGPGRAIIGAVARRPVTEQIAISRYVAASIDGSSTIVHPGVSTRPEPEPSARRRRVLLVAQRLEAEKETDVALRIFARSGLARQGWRMELAGMGSQRSALSDLVQELDLAGTVDFLGLRADIEDLMRSAGILLAPCPIEGLGLSVLEAMANGLPVVAAAAGGHVELLEALDERALFAVGNISSAAAQLTDLARDESGRDAYAFRAQVRQRSDFTLKAQVVATDSVYRAVL